MGKQELKIGVDLDDTVFEFMKSFLKIFEERYRKKISFEEVISYDLSFLTGLETDKIVELIKNIGNENFVLCEGAKESILELSENNKIFFITSRVFRDGTLESLKKTFPKMNFDLIFSHNPYVKTGKKTKSEICRNLGINFMIEDDLIHSEKCAKEGVKTLLLEKPWNQSYEDNENIIRVTGWPEIVEKINIGVKGDGD